MSLQKPVTKPRVNSAFKELMSMHWIMAACYLVLFTVGAFMAQLPRELFIRNLLYDFHKSMGVLVMALLTWRILILLRVWWRKYTKRPPKFTQEWFKKIALHTTLYVFMWVVPVSGFFFSNSFKSKNMRFFGITLADVFPENSAMVELGRSLHFWLAYTFLTFIFLHTLREWKVVRANWRRLLGSVKTRFARHQRAR